MMLTHCHAQDTLLTLRTGPGACGGAPCPPLAERGAVSPALQPLLLGQQLAQQASVFPGTWLHVWMLTLLMARLQHSNERNNVCFDQFDNSFKSIVPEPWRQKATPLLHAGTVSLCEVIETCGNNIWFKADSEILFLNNNSIVFLWSWSCSWEQTSPGKELVKFSVADF